MGEIVGAIQWVDDPAKVAAKAPQDRGIGKGGFLAHMAASGRMRARPSARIASLSLSAIVTRSSEAFSIMSAAARC
jgi:hypothetical protein